jgi:hypothetical protein
MAKSGNGIDSNISKKPVNVTDSAMPNFNKYSEEVGSSIELLQNSLTNQGVSAQQSASFMEAIKKDTFNVSQLTPEFVTKYKDSLNALNQIDFSKSFTDLQSRFDGFAPEAVQYYKDKLMSYNINVQELNAAGIVSAIESSVIDSGKTLTEGLPKLDKEIIEIYNKAIDSGFKDTFKDLDTKTLEVYKAFLSAHDVDTSGMDQEQIVLETMDILSDLNLEYGNLSIGMKEAIDELGDFSDILDPTGNLEAINESYSGIKTVLDSTAKDFNNLPTSDTAKSLEDLYVNFINTGNSTSYLGTSAFDTSGLMLSGAVGFVNGINNLTPANEDKPKGPEIGRAHV